MDRVRFGRALGFGTRQALKTLVTAVDAATAENPTGKTASTGANGGRPPQRRATDATGAGATTGQAAARTAPDAAARKAIDTAARTVQQARGVEEGLRRGSQRFRETVWGRFKVLGGVLWLEVSGAFFGLFALFALGAVLRLRGQWHANAAGHRSLVVSVLMLALFSYFCVSNFVRAWRRERRR